jgi:short-subunit dehydrogenase
VIPWSSAERISAPSSALDLADPSPQRITEEIERRRIHVDISSNNAGFSLSGEFLSHDPMAGVWLPPYDTA